jgi:uncharacterized membrane protein
VSIDAAFHEAAPDFTSTEAALDACDCIILNDIGAGRCAVAGGLDSLAPMMVGGNYSLQGINGAARYSKTAAEAVLIVWHILSCERKQPDEWPKSWSDKTLRDGCHR